MPELRSAAVYRVGETVVTGEADIALHRIPELMAVPSIEIVGPLPSDLHSITAF
jgi:molybdate transport system substrate-binding protein